MNNQPVQMAGPPPPVPGQQIIIYTNKIKNKQKILIDFDPKLPRLLGILKIVLAVLSVILDAIAIVLEEDRDAEYGTSIFIIGFGYWCPIFYFISGSIAVGIAKRKTLSMVRALLGMSVMSIIMGIMQFSGLVPAAIIVNQNNESEDGVPGVTVLAVLLLLIGLAEAALSIWLCKLCGDHICCVQQTPVAVNSATVQIPYSSTNAAPGNHGPGIPVNSQQPVQVHGAPTMYPTQQQPGNIAAYPQQQGYIAQGGAVVTTMYPPQHMVYVPAAGHNNFAFAQAPQSPSGQAAMPESQPPAYEEEPRKDVRSDQ